MTRSDLLSPTGDDHAVTGQYLAAAIRRRRGTIFATACLCAFVALAATVFMPKASTASTTLLLRYPSGVDPSHAINTDLTLLKTRPVAIAALTSLRSNVSPTILLTQYRGAVLSDGVMAITASAPTARLATRRADAIAAAFLRFRAQLAREQLDAENAALRAQSPTDPQIDAEIRDATIAADSVNRASRVIDAATVEPAHTKKKAAINSLSGALAGLVVSTASVLLFAVVAPRVRRRADVAAALRAPVALSVGPVVRNGWRRLLPGHRVSPDRPNADVVRIVRHLQRTITLTSARALVVVSIDSMRVARLVLRVCERELGGLGRRVIVVTGDGEGARDERAGRRAGKTKVVKPSSVDIVLVLVELDPARGADHLREWATNAVVLVTSGRSTKAKLEANARMIRSASLDLHSAVLIDAEPDDETLGIFEDREPLVRSEHEAADSAIELPNRR